MKLNASDTYPGKMLISYSHKFIFIHIYKVAGTSIRKTLAPYSYDPDVFLPTRVLRKFGLHNYVQHHRLQKLAGHASARQIKAALPPGMFDEFYKFAFVRNPWDWQVSLYHFALRDESHFQHELIKSMGNFETYLDWRISEDKHLQKDFLVDDNGKLMVDFIGRYESLDRDFKEVCDKFGIAYELPHLNKTPRQDYASYYTPETAAIVADEFKEDVELLGYEFGDHRLLPPILGPGEAERVNSQSARVAASV